MGSKDDITVKASAALRHIWDGNADLIGRTWGRKKNGRVNPFFGTNITLAKGDEMVSVCERNGELVIHQFKRTDSTELGEEIKKALIKSGLI
ncbi:MAG TPA: hypothetical protein P5262_02760 [Candidatus Moranbacteria bacterium]|nr:hypothetical protein [Candidatus Moranbacteria bacterium]